MENVTFPDIYVHSDRHSCFPCLKFDERNERFDISVRTHVSTFHIQSNETTKTLILQ